MRFDSNLGTNAVSFLSFIAYCDYNFVNFLFSKNECESKLSGAKEGRHASCTFSLCSNRNLTFDSLAEVFKGMRKMQRLVLPNNDAHLSHWCHSYWCHFPKWKIIDKLKKHAAVAHTKCHTIRSLVAESFAQQNVLAHCFVLDLLSN